MDDLKQLPPRKQKYALARLKGKNKKESALVAGYAPSTNTHLIETPDFKEAFANALRRRAGIEDVTKTLKRGLKAKKVHWATLEGKFTDFRETPDYKEQRESAALIAQMAGYWTPKQEIKHENTLDAATQKRLEALAEKLQLSELDYEVRRELRKSYVMLDANQLQDGKPQPVDQLQHGMCENAPEDEKTPRK